MLTQTNFRKIYYGRRRVDCRNDFSNTLQEHLGAYSEKSEFSHVIVMHFYMVYYIVCYVWLTINLTPRIVIRAVHFIFFIYLVCF